MGKEERRVRIGHSPDADDAFMFYGIARGLVKEPGFAVEEVIEGIEELNQRALRGELELTAISFHAYAYCADKYRLMTCGGSLGMGYGPIVVSRKQSLDRKSGAVRAALPGELTSASLLLGLYAPKWKTTQVPFDEVLDRVAAGEMEAGVVIHEGQLSYPEHGLQKVADLGEWWSRETDLPVPLGGNVIRKDLSGEDALRLQGLLRRSIEIAKTRREEALDFALPYARGLDRDLTSRFIDMYVNDLTIDFGVKGRQAVRELLRRGYEAGLLPQAIEPEFLENPENPGRREGDHGKGSEG